VNGQYVVRRDMFRSDKTIHRLQLEKRQLSVQGLFNRWLSTMLTRCKKRSEYFIRCLWNAKTCFMLNTVISKLI